MKKAFYGIGEVILSAGLFAIALMAVAIYGLVIFSLGLKVDSDGELSYR